MFDAYTVKKVVPRLVAAIILIQLSWFIFTNMLRITNDIAFGLEGLMFAPFGGKDALQLSSLISTLAGSGAGKGLFTLMVIAGGATVGIAMTALGVLSLAVTALMGAMIALFILALRRVILIALLIVSPIALVAWILPGTEKYWKIWWESFSKLLMMFPMIILIISAGRVLAFVTMGTPGGNGVVASTTQGISEWILVIVCYFGPYFIIPKTFAMAGTALSSLAGMANDRSRGVFDRLKKGRQNMAQRGWEDKKSGNWFKHAKDGSARSRLNTGMQSAMFANKAGFNPAQWRSRVGSARADKSMLDTQKMMEDEDYQSWKGNDDLNLAASNSRDAASLRRRLIDSGAYHHRNNDGDSVLDEYNLDRDISRVERVRAKYSSSTFKQATHAMAVAGGTSLDTGEGTPNFLEDAARVAGRDDTVLASLVNKDRGALTGAGRVDQLASFGDSLDIARDTRNGVTTAQTQERMWEAAYDSQGAGVITHPSMKNSTIENFAPRMVARVQNAVQSGDRRQVAQALSELHSVRKTLAATNPAKARILADQVMGQASGIVGADGQGRTISQAIDDFQGDAAFREAQDVYVGVPNGPPPQGPAPPGPPPPPGAPPPGPPGPLG